MPPLQVQFRSLKDRRNRLLSVTFLDLAMADSLLGRRRTGSHPGTMIHRLQMRLWNVPRMEIRLGSAMAGFKLERKKTNFRLEVMARKLQKLRPMERCPQEMSCHHQG